MRRDPSTSFPPEGADGSKCTTAMLPSGVKDTVFGRSSNAYDEVGEIWFTKSQPC